MNAPVTFVKSEPLSRRRVSPVLWVAGIISAGFLFRFDIGNFADGFVTGNTYWGRDFVNVWTGGHLVRSGDFATLYDIDAYRRFQRTLFGPIARHNYSYPPVSFPLAALFSLLPYWAALVAWLAGTGALFVQACRRWWPAEAGAPWLALLTPAALLNVWAGHYGFLLGALFLFGWDRLDRKPVQAGVLFGCMLIKPHLALMVGGALLVRRAWTAIAAGAATVGVLVAVTGLAFGWELWPEYLFGVGRTQAGMIDAEDNLFGLMSTSVATALLRLTHHLGPVSAVQTAVSLTAVAAVALAARSCRSTRQLALFAATCTFLALPYAFNYDLTVVMLGALVALANGRNAGERLIAGIAFLAPSWGMLAAYFAVPAIPLALAGLAMVQWRQLREGRREAWASAPVPLSGCSTATARG